jgi:hypothetical protein
MQQSEEVRRATEIAARTGLSLLAVRKFQEDGMPDGSAELATLWIRANAPVRIRGRIAEAGGDGICCIRCEQTKPITEYWKRDGVHYDHRCKACMRIASEQRRRRDGIKERTCDPRVAHIADPRDRKNARNHLRRAEEAARKGRELMPAKSDGRPKCEEHVKAWRRWQYETRRGMYELFESGHNAHVGAYRRERRRIKDAEEWRDPNSRKREYDAAFKKKARDELADSYVRKKLAKKTTGLLRAAEFPQEIVAAQRLVLKIKRASKEQT